MSDYMKEAERLLAEHEQAAGLCRYADCQTTRAALLAHIQRGAVPEALDPEFLIGYLEEREDWRGREVLIERIRQVAAPDHFRGVTKMVTAQPRVETFDVDFLACLGAEVPTPAEVPMPEPAHKFFHEACSDFLAYTANQMQQFGEQCRAAGEAAGYAQGLRDAVRGADIAALDRARERISQAALRGEAES